MGFLSFAPVAVAAWMLVLQLPRASWAQFNNPPGVDIWCGKAYRATNASFNPGGWFEDPPVSKDPLLNLRVRPRMSIYLDDETVGSILIDAAISHQVGQPLPVPAFSPPVADPGMLHVDILLDGHLLETAFVPVGTADNEVVLDLNRVPSTLAASNVSIRASLDGHDTKYLASTEFFRLPLPETYGSVSRIDNLYGGLWVCRKDEAWKHIFPYTYYVQWSLYWDSNVTTLDEFAAMGYNVIHIVPTGTLGDKPFPWDQFEPYLDRADELGLYLQYDVIWDYTNLAGMVDQVERLRKHRSLLLYYQSDEPDGKSLPTNSTGIAYKKIRELDPYHPASLALNCYDFYYQDYASGADIITPDVYHVSVNTSYSTVYDTVCNSTYGCCGCDDCKGEFEDIASRLDEFHRRDALIGWSKTQWFAPQAFGNETFWTRYPTAAEEVVMTMMGINHGAKGIVMWNFPTSDEILNVTNHLASVLTTDKIADFFLEAPHTQQLLVTGAERVDAAAWVNRDKKQVLLSVANLNYANQNERVKVALPPGVRVTSVGEVLWGDVNWDVGCRGDAIVSKSGLLGLQVSVVIADLE